MSAIQTQNRLPRPDVQITAIIIEKVSQRRSPATSRIQQCAGAFDDRGKRHGSWNVIVKRLRSTEKGMSILSGRNASFVVRKVVV